MPTPRVSARGLPDLERALRLDELPAVTEATEDPPDPRHRQGEAVAGENDLELVLAPAGVLLAQPLDGLHLLVRPGPRPGPLRPTGATFQRAEVRRGVAAFPLVERLAADPEVATGERHVAVRGVMVHPPQALLGIRRQLGRRTLGQAFGRPRRRANYLHQRGLRRQGAGRGGTLHHRASPVGRGFGRFHPTVRRSPLTTRGTRTRALREGTNAPPLRFLLHVPFITAVNDLLELTQA